MSIARPRKISEIKPIFGNLAQTSHYQVSFGSLPLSLQTYLSMRGVDWRFIAENAGLLCSSASLPGSSLATADISGNFTGVMESFAHTRIFTPITLTFYVDKEYKVLKFLEHWIEFIASGSGVSNSNGGYFFRMRYPNNYKCDTTKIIKFNRDYKEEIEYNFFGMFPQALSSPTVSYDESQILTATATFNYERYVSGYVNSVSIAGEYNNNKNGNKSSTVSAKSEKSTKLATGREELLWRNRDEGTGRLDDPRPRGIR